MSKQIFSIFYLLLLAAILWVAALLAACQSAAPPFECTDAIGCLTIGPNEPIKIGVLQTLSGQVADYGADQVRGIELALADRNGELLGHPVQLLMEDDLCSREGGATAMQKFVTDPQIVAILGTSCSGAAVPAAKVMSEAGLVMISGSNTAPSLTQVEGKRGVDWQPGYFRTVYNDAGQGRTAATFAFQELGVKRAATINDGDTYTLGLTTAFSQVFSELGGEIVLAAAVNKGDTDMGPVLAAVVDSEAELLFLPLFQPEGDFIVLQAQETTGMEGVALMGADGLLLTAFIESVGPAGVGMYLAGPQTPDNPAYDALLAKYKAKYGDPPPGLLLANAYDGANLFFEGIKTIASSSQDGTLRIGRQALREVLYATSGFPGVTGSLTCDEFGDCGVDKFKIVRLDDPTAGMEGLANNVVYTYSSGE